MAVGAAFYGNTPEFGINPALLEPFSSAGRTRILFTTDGTSTLDLRQKPEFVAPDGVNTTFFGCCDVEPDGVPNFFGTSASTPHAAGVAALMLQAKPSLSPDQIRMTLQDTALDMGTPGVDDDSGYGLISAFAAVEAVVNDVITLMPPDATNEVGQEHTVTATLTDGLGTPQPGVRVTFSVFDGPNVGITSNTDGLCSPNADCTTDANGEVSFTYLGIGGVGTDHIHACFVNQFEEEVCSSVVTMEWTAAVVRSCPDVPPAPAEVPLGYTLKVGSDGNDVLFGTPGNDMIFGLGGNDRILGLGGDDILCGGPGNDTIYGGDGKDFIDGGPGNDSLYGESGDDTILGGDGDDRLYGQGGDDDLDGGRGNDEIYGGTGQDVLRGGEGDDRLSGQGGDDDLDGEAGNNRLDGGTGIDTCINGVRINCEG
jgi:Ca2+-binding RTX toxin-like protein